jgi:NitT/TauT family transport system ATP-binding protein
MISINNLSKKYDDNVLFDNFSCEVSEGSFTCLLGPSGSGKTTLLHMIADLTKPDKGQISCKADVSYIFQETRLLPWATVKENLEFVIKSKNQDKAWNNAAINRNLSLVNLLEYRDYYPNQLSGGMKQRASIARALTYDADIILMDEPFKGLDKELKKDIMIKIKKIGKESKKTILMVTHDESEALFLADVIYELEGKPAKLRKWRG